MKEFIEQTFITGMDMEQAILAMFLSFCLGLAISSTYRYSGSSFTRSDSMSFTFLMVTMIITAILISLGNNIALSLGLIGSLSVIRFRTPIKDPEDMVYLFWAIATGLAVGAGNFIFAVFLTIFMSIIIYFFAKKALSKLSSQGYILILDFDEGDHVLEKIAQVFSKYNIKWKLKSTLSDNDANRSEMVFDIYPSRKAEHLHGAISSIRGMEWVKKVSLISSDSYSVI